MFLYIITALSVLAVVCLSAVIAQKARRFDYAEYVTGGDYATNIKQLALALKDVEKVGAVPDVNAVLRRIRRAYKVVCLKVKRGDSLYECEKWLYENFRSFTLGIRRSNYKSFALLPHKGDARVLHLATTVASQTYCRLDADVVAAAVHEFCRYTPLTFDEICALKGAFEVALLKKIAFVCKKIRILEKTKRRAEEDKEPDYRYGKKEGYLYFYKAAGKKIPEKFLSKNTQINIENVDFAFAGAITDYARLISNAVTSLKNLSDFMTDDFCISLSPINGYFERDKSYKESDFSSKGQYLSAVSKLSRYFNASEYAIAKGAFDLAARFDMHFGEIIFDCRYSLRAYLKGKRVEDLKSNTYSLDKWIYYGSIFLLQTVFSLLAGIFLPPLWLKITVCALTFVAAYPPCEYIAERIISYFLPKRPVPRMNYMSVPDAGRTAVVVSHYLEDAEQAEKAVKDILALQAVNSDPNVCYYLLCDLRSAKSQTDVGDEDVISVLKQCEGRQNVVALVRRRVKTGKNYGAYERKRGAIRDLNESLLSGDTAKFCYVSAQHAFRPEFVMVLDADSRLGAGEVKTAINTALHPLNAKFDMLTFTSTYSLPSLNTPYSKKFRDNAGAQTYCNYDDFYFNLCNRSVFCGKGIYRLEPFHEKTSVAVPDGKVLSHDILEGALTHTGMLNLATSEDAPDTFVSDVARDKRWMRGDLLLIPFASKKYCSDGIYSYIILKNAFSYLAPLAALALWILAFTEGYMLQLLGLFFASFAAPVASLAIMTATSDGVRPTEVIRRVFTTVSHALLNVVLLPFFALKNLTVIIGTFKDYVFNSSSLLKWKPFASTLGIKGYAKHAAVVAPSCIIVAIAAAALYFNVAFAIYALIFIASVNLIYFAGKSKKKQGFSEDNTAVLKEYATATYRYFQELSGEDLPCDNIQIFPPKGKSGTTSPTNLGYAILSHICAAEIGIVSVHRAHSEICRILDDCEKLDKWKGHLYNWYDVTLKKPVNPYFISTVDSGNFIAAVIVCKEFCKHNGFLSTAERCKKIIDETDFSALVDKIKNQLYIGYNTVAKRFEGHYDLLASEARLTSYIACCKTGDSSLWGGMSRVQVGLFGNTLASWSGTAFEYLMPQLFLKDVNNSLITTSAQRAVRTFISRKCNGLWGVSESGYYAFDENANYQYRAHGLGELALRSASDRCVISPYSSVLALRYEPKKVMDNLAKLESSGAYGEYGFYEAVDYSSGKNTVKSDMTHHQGMIMCALTNALCDDAIVKYFNSDDCMRGGELLLAEPEIPVVTRRENKRDFVYDKKDSFYGEEISLSEFPKVCMLYGREYVVVVDDYGCGYSRWRDKDVNAFSSNCYKSSGGFGYFISEGERFSPTFAPLKKDGGFFKARFESGSAFYENTKRSCTMRVYTPSVISGEVREFTVKNTTDRVKNYEFVFAERTALAGREEYSAHPAFCDLFVNARFDREKKTAYLKRKPREATGGFTVAATMLADAEVVAECNRQNLFGRNRDESNPDLKFGSQEPSEGDAITPCIGLKCAFSLSPGQSKSVAVIIQCCESEETLENRVEQVLATDFLGYAKVGTAEGRSDVLGKYLSDGEIARYAGRLAAKLLYEPYPKTALLARMQNSSRIVFSEKTLVLQYDGNASFTKKAVKSALACRLLGINLRLVVLYDEHDGYNSVTASEICERSTVSDLASLPFVSFIDKNAYKPQDIKSFLASAFFVMKEFDYKDPQISIAVRRKSGDIAFEDCEKPLEYVSGNGGFDINGDYIVTEKPKAPYSNVVCAKLGGFVATENGGGYCYFLNSQANKLSGWSNDPVSDAPFERVLVSDGTSVIRVNKLNDGGYVRHAKGYTEYVSRTARAEYRLKRTLTEEGRIQYIRLEIKNRDQKNLSLDVSYLLEPSADSSENRTDVFCESVAKDAVRVVNVKTSSQFFLLCKGESQLITDCIQALSRGVNGYNPKRGASVFNNPLCGAIMQTVVRKKSVAAVEFALCDSEEMLEVARNSDLYAAAIECENGLAHISRTRLTSSDKALDALYANLPYQVVSSRINGRCGFYQAGGAIGFRDQLQDCLALLWCDPERVREHILLCAERQYIEGDVMHWWHAPAFGVRTRITDDRLFLPYVVCEYIAHTGDESILQEKCDYLVGAPLDTLQEARLEHGQYAGARESLLLHMQRAIDSALVTGEHGLLLIGGGDWNDALNEIGLRGRGESVWLTEFAIEVIDKFCAYIDDESAKRYKKAADKLRKAVDNAFFEGKWARAFTDGGEWLGVKRSKACKTDLISQSWAQIILAGDETMRKSAMKAAKTLVDEECGAVKLFAPPFDGKARYGYISSYPEGVRENGGQYTHAAVWYLLACCRAGDKAEANRVLKILNPVTRCKDKEKNSAYMAEPYVLAGDVYTNKDNRGRAGWTWYTGSAAWLYKVITEEMLGIRKRGEELEFGEPLLENAEDAVFEYVYRDTLYEIRFEKSDRRGIRTGGVNYTNCMVLPLKNKGGRIEVTVLF